MITKIRINGFKTFLDFEMEFSPLTVIVGTNASGKSNLFDALKLLSRLAETDLKTAFKEQRGEALELFTQFSEDWYADEMSFAVEMLINKKVHDNWGSEVDLKYTRLRYELIIQRRKNEKGFEDLYVTHEALNPLKHREDHWIEKFVPKAQLEFWRPKVSGRRGIPYISTELKDNIPTIKIPQDGRQGGKATPANAITQTVLSGINSVDFPHVFGAKEEMRNWKFLQLNPQALREPTRQDLGVKDVISQSGENLAAALYRITLDDDYALKKISQRLNNLLPTLTDVNVYNDKANQQFIIKIRSEDGREFSSRVLSEGTLRLLTLCILQNDEQHHGLLCFEEPENGIHPARIRAMAQLLKELSVDFTNTTTTLRQIIVNTHSPVLMGEIFNLNADQSVKTWLSQLVTRIGEVEYKGENHTEVRKIKSHISRMFPVERGEAQFDLSFSEFEQKWTRFEVAKYLEFADFETTIEMLKSK